VFGQVTEGLDVITKLQRGDVMEKVTVSDSAAA
jgi:cyclophilin family peptidyl-prolyl cis-trans isomerase